MRTHSKIYTLEKYYACLYVSPSSKKSIYHQLFYGIQLLVLLEKVAGLDIQRRIQDWFCLIPCLCLQTF